jgi:transposase
LKRRGGSSLEFQCGNDQDGFEQIISALGKDVKATRVVLEATSRYHMEISRALQEAGASVQVLNPFKARSLALGLGVMDKDDKIDARVLARAAEVLDVKRTELRNRLHEELRDLSRFIDCQTQINAENKKRLGSAVEGSKTYERLSATIKALKEQIVLAKKQWHDLVKSEPEILRRYTLALSVAGVGKETARVTACELPARLDEFQNKELCAYGGVVPRRKQSGKTLDKSSIGKQGNAHLRTGLFMASTWTVFKGKMNEAFYLKLRSKGKTHKQAMIAVVHKLLRQVVAVLKRNSPWNELPPNIQGKTPLSDGVAT